MAVRRQIRVYPAELSGTEIYVPYALFAITIEDDSMDVSALPSIEGLRLTGFTYVETVSLSSRVGTERHTDWQDAITV